MNQQPCREKYTPARRPCPQKHYDSALPGGGSGLIPAAKSPEEYTSECPIIADDEHHPFARRQITPRTMQERRRHHEAWDSYQTALTAAGSEGTVCAGFNREQRYTSEDGACVPNV